MTEPLTADQRVVPWACRIFGHQWSPAHRLDDAKYGFKVWVYTDHVCLRCYATKYKLPDPRQWEAMGRANYVGDGP